MIKFVSSTQMIDEEIEKSLCELLENCIGYVEEALMEEVELEENEMVL